MQLRANKAKFVGKALLRRWVFPLNKGKPYDEYVRVRSDGKKSTLTYKFRKGKGLRNTEEIETEIENFEVAAKIFSKLFKRKYYHENIRYTYLHGKNEVTINEWPGIPPYLEVEGPSVRDVKNCIKTLGIKGKDFGNTSIVELYKYYGKDMHRTSSLKF